jgi:hypothetical protein
VTGRRASAAPAWAVARGLAGLAVALVLGVGLGALTLVAPALPLAAAAALAGFALLVAARSLRPLLPLYGVVLLIPFTSAMPRGELVPLLAPNEVALLGTMLLGLVYALLAGRRNPVPTTVLVAVAAFALGTSLVPLGAYLVRDVPLSTADLFSLLAPLHYLLLFWLFANVPRSDRERRATIQLMVLAGSAVALIGLLQAAGVGPVTAWLERWYPHAHLLSAEEVGRVTSVLGAWNSLGLFLLTTLLLIAATYVDETRRLYRRNMQVATVLALLCLLATNLYSGLIGVAIGFLLIKRLDPRGLRAVVPIAVIGAVGFVLLLPELSHRFSQQFGTGTWVPQTIGYRWWVWQEYFIPPIAASPIWGVHPTFGHLAFPHPESQYIHYLFRSGAVSLVGHLIWLGALVAWLVRVRSRLARAATRSLALAPLALMLVFSLIGVINPVFTYTASMGYFWIVLGLIVNAYEEERPRAPVPRGPVLPAPSAD